MAEKINAYFLRCDPFRQYKGYVGQIENTLGAMQEYVDGLIQVIPLTPEIAVICNDEGKLLQLPFNRVWMLAETYVQDYFVGNILCVRRNGEEFASIEPEDAAEIEHCLIPLKSVLKAKDHIIFMTYPADYCAEWQE